MKVSRFFALVAAVVFTIAVAGSVFAEVVIQERTGKITNIAGTKVTIKAKDGRIVTGEVNSTQGLGVGDEVAFKEVDSRGQTKAFIIDGGRTQRPGLTQGFSPDTGQKKGPEPHMK